MTEILLQKEKKLQKVEQERYYERKVAERANAIIRNWSPSYTYMKKYVSILFASFL